MMRIVPVPCLKDNYAYLVISDAATRPSSTRRRPRRCATRCGAKGVRAKAIWSTHHHHDHVGGNEELAKELGLEVVGPRVGPGARPGADARGRHGGHVRVGDVEARCIHIPGHTLGAVAYFVDARRARAPSSPATRSSAPAAGASSRARPRRCTRRSRALLALPGDTRVHCGHEYTESNLRFAAHVEPSNARRPPGAGAGRASCAAKGKPTIGTTLDEERRTNPFLRVRSPEIRETLGIAADADDVTAFAAIRAAKDSFR